MRIPASFCGICGLRPTHGRIPLDGMLMSAPDYDTAGWFARDAALLARVGEILLQSRIPTARPALVLIAEDAFDAADSEVVTALRPVAEKVAIMAADTRGVRLSDAGLGAWVRQQSILALRQSLASAQEWIERVDPRFGFEVARRFTDAMAISDADVEQAQTEREAIIHRMAEVLEDGAVVCLPTTPMPAPPVGLSVPERYAHRARILALTCIAGTIGAPQISLPLARVDGLPVGLSLIGARGADELLLGFAGEIASVLQPTLNSEL